MCVQASAHVHCPRFPTSVAKPPVSTSSKADGYSLHAHNRRNRLHLPPPASSCSQAGVFLALPPSVPPSLSCYPRLVLLLHRVVQVHGRGLRGRPPLAPARLGRRGGGGRHASTLGPVAAEHLGGGRPVLPELRRRQPRRDRVRVQLRAVPALPAAHRADASGGLGADDAGLDGSDQGGAERLAAVPEALQVLAFARLLSLDARKRHLRALVRTLSPVPPPSLFGHSRSSCVGASPEASLHALAHLLRFVVVALRERVDAVQLQHLADRVALVRRKKLLDPIQPHVACPKPLPVYRVDLRVRVAVSHPLDVADKELPSTFFPREV
mmetsp:Transcript_36036/g.84690  ORF Transcript_36036/g.84690 Transcript_36036/m.84690 type:complete len:325 (+) Transcript_36036:13-987(+)